MRLNKTAQREVAISIAVNKLSIWTFSGLYVEVQERLHTRPFWTGEAEGKIPFMIPAD